jgi:hypothetical protein
MHKNYLYCIDTQINNLKLLPWIENRNILKYIFPFES